MIQRLQELYNQGGFREIHRGIHDYLIFDVGIPFHLLYQTKDLRVNDTAVTIRVYDAVSYSRSNGWGEMPMLEDYTERVTETDTVWDIGANIGPYSLLAAEQRAGVIAFEPGEKAYTELRHNARLNDTDRLITAIPIALSDTNGYQTLSKTSRSGTRELTKNQSEGDIVPILTGDSLDCDNPSVIKIDVEGHEYSVLKGLKDTLKTVETIYLEIHEKPYIEILNLLWDSGFTITAEWNERTDQIHMRLDK